jgi:hypothetical protein
MLARAGALAVLAYVALVALWLLVFGLPITSYQELPEGFQGAPYLRSTYSQPYPAAAVYLGLTGLAVIGLIRRKWLWLAWLSVALITMWSALWLFSSGAALLLANGILIVLLAVITRTWIKPGR